MRRMRCGRLRERSAGEEAASSAASRRRREIIARPAPHPHRRRRARGSRRTGGATASRSGRRAAAARRACPARRCGPASSTTRRSMRAMVDRRCAIAITVLPSIRLEQLLLDRELDLAVERRGGLVEHQDRRVLQDHARDRDALALAARELDAALADVRLVAGAAVPVPQADDELVRLRLARRRDRPAASLARGPAVADVGGDRAVQQRRVLRHHADRRAQALLRRRCAMSWPSMQDAALLRARGSAAAG